ncbi:MAG: peptidogalycan biosysnthesis protein [Anaerolineales bacterium]
MTSFHVKTFYSIRDVDAAVWDQLSGHSPFQSHRWYTFGERVMADCPPVYLLVYDNKSLVARASFWLVRNEPLPKMPAPVKLLVKTLLKRWPLLICRSPMANTSGIIMENGLQSEAILDMISEAAIAEGSKRNASIVLFDFLDISETQGWPSNFVKLKMPGPGTILKNHWQSLEDYLADGNKKDRQHYRRSLREADRLGIRLTQHKSISDIDSALALIRKVEHRYSSSPNPWLSSMLENIEMIDGTWLEAHIEGKLVGCGLIVNDNNVQMTTALGLADNIPYVYFLLIYASLESAFTRKIKLLRWGSGAYEVKQRLGFELEQNNNSVLAGTNQLTHFLSRIAA